MKNEFSTFTRKLSVSMLAKKFDNKRIFFSPGDQIDCQRVATDSLSLIVMGFDIPPALAQEDQDGKYKIISKGRPLYSLIKFINGEFSLSENKLVSELSGKSFDELDPICSNKILDHFVSISTFLAPSLGAEDVEEIVTLFNSI